MKTKLQYLLILMLAVFIRPDIGSAQATLWTQDFEGSFPPTGWKIVNNGSGNNWVKYPYGSNKNMYYKYNSSNAADAWAFTKEISADSGTVVKVLFSYRTASSYYAEKMRIVLCDTQDVATGQADTLWDNAGGSSLNNTYWVTDTLTFNITADSSFYLAFNVYSDADMYNLFVDNIRVLMYSPHDLTIASVEEPIDGSAPDTAKLVKVKIKNVGLADMDSCTVKYSIDGGFSYVTEVCHDTIQPDSIHIYTFSATADMSSAGQYFMKVKLGDDDYNGNNTFDYSPWIGMPLKGTYTIGADLGNDFSSLSSAVANLTHFGIDSSVFFHLVDTLYNEQVEIVGPVVGTSISNTITFKGNGDSTVISHSTTSSKKALFLIKDAANIIIDSIKLMSNQNTNICGVQIINSDSITIKNCFIKLKKLTSSSTSYGIFVNGSTTNTYTGGKSDYLTINNNKIIGSSNSIYLKGLSNHSKAIIVSNNTIKDYYYYGIYSYYQDSVKLNNNIISSSGNYSNPTAIYARSINKGSKIAYNDITLNNASSGYGIKLYYCSGDSANRIMVYNNMVATPNAGVGSMYGFYVYGTSYANFYYNTADIKGSNYSKAFYLAGTFSDISLKNNIFSNRGDGYAIYFYGNYDSTKVNVCDYNNFYSTQGLFAHYGGYGTSYDYADLDEWKTATALVYAMDTNSISTDPLFISESDLHANSIPQNGAAITIIGIDDDIDGETRSGSSPDIGADEYTPPADEVQILAYYSQSGPSCAYTSDDDIVVILKNNGTNTQTSLSIKYQINGGSVVSETVSSLLSLEVDTFTFPTQADFSVAGEYNVLVYLSAVQDEKRDNDTIRATLFKVGGISSYPYDQNFNSIPMEFGRKETAHTRILIDTIDNSTDSVGVIMRGFDGAGWSYVGYGQGVTAFNNNPNFISELTACNINTSSVSNLAMHFDLKLNASYYSTWSNAQNSCFFRVMLNDSVYAKDINGDSIWEPHSLNSDPFKTLLFNVSDYAGQSIFKVSLQSVTRFDVNHYYYGSSDEAFIDNFRLWEPVANDFGVTTMINPVTKNCGTNTDTVRVVISNFGINAIDSIPVSVVFTDPQGIATTIDTVYTDTINSFAFDTIAVGVYDDFNDGTYTYKAYTSFGSDVNHVNDTLASDFTIEYPLSIPYIQNFNYASDEFDGNGYYNSWDKRYEFAMYSYSSYPDNYYLEFKKKIGAVSSTDVLSFKMACGGWYGGFDFYEDSLIVLVRSNCTNVWDTLAVVDSTNQQLPSSQYNYYRYSFPLTSYVGDNVHIRFYMKNAKNSSYVRLDDVGISTPPEVDLGNDTTVCANLAFELSTNYDANYKYKWMDTSGTVLHNYDTLNTFSVYTAGSYVVVAKTPQGFYAKDTINVSNFAVDTASISGFDSTYCNNGMNSTLIGLPSGGFFTGDGVDSAGTFDPTSVGLGSVAVSYTVYDANNCPLIATESSFVNKSPVVSVTPDNAICEGESVDLKANVTLDFIPTSLMFSTYIEGSSNNKALEVVNISQKIINLDDYIIASNHNGSAWSGQYHFPTGTTLAPGEFFVIVNNQADSALLVQGDDSLAYNEGGYVVSFNGDDVRAIFMYNSATDSVMIDIIGSNDLSDPGTAWSVAGFNGATKDKTLSRKHTVADVNTDWNSIAGTDTLNSEYIVSAKNDFSTLGTFVSTGTPVNKLPTYLWSTNDTIDMITVSPIATVNYTIGVSNENCSTYDTITVTVNSNPVVSFTGLDANYCINSNDAVLTATPNGGTFTGTGMTGSTFSPVSAGVGNYDIDYTYTDLNGCSDSVTNSTIVSALPDVTVSATTNPVVYNNSTSITATVSNAIGNMSYAWTPANEINGSALQQTITTNNIQFVTTYFVDAYDSSTICHNSDTITITYTGGVIGVNPIASDTVICNGETVSLFAQGGGSSSLTYTWTSNPSGYTSTLETPTANPTVNTWYIVAATDGTTTATDSILITVNPLPTVTFTSLASSYCDNDDSIALSALPTGGVFSGVGVNDTLFSPMTAGAGSQDITYTYTDANGCTNSEMVTTMVNVAPTVELTLNQICAGGAIFTLNGGTPYGGTYSGTGVDISSNYDPSFGTNDITYNYTDNNGCSGVAVATQYVNALPDITVTASTNPVPYNDSTILTATVSNALGNLSYLWTPDNLIDGDSSLQIVTTTAIVEVNTYYVNVIDDSTNCSNTSNISLSYTGGDLSINPTAVPTTICLGDSTAINAQAAGGNSAITYAWTSNPAGFVSTDSIVYVTPTVDTWYILSATNSDTTLTDSILVSLHSVPTLAFTGLDSINCENAAVNNLVAYPAGGVFVGVGVNGVTFNPVVAGLGSHDVEYKYSDANGCAYSITNTTTVVSLPTVSFSGLSASYCSNGIGDTLVGLQTGGTFAGNGIVGNYYDPTLSSAGVDTISYTYTDANACSNSTEQYTTVYDGPSTIISNDTTICEGDDALLTVSSPDANVTFLWSNGLTTSTINVGPTATTAYSVTANNGNCSTIDTVVVTVNPLPVVDLGGDVTIKWTAGSVTLDAGNSGATYLWNTTSTSQTETFDNTNLTNGTDNTVYVEVTENGCMASDTVIITVLDDVSINGAFANMNVEMYPNPNNGQFTLNIDGINGQLNMNIIDLAGQVVYSTKLDATMNFTTKVDVRTLAKGVYYIKLSNNDGAKTLKFVIK